MRCSDTVPLLVDNSLPSRRLFPSSLRIGGNHTPSDMRPRYYDQQTNSYESDDDVSSFILFYFIPSSSFNCHSQNMRTAREQEEDDDDMVLEGLFIFHYSSML
jgi:hypothetical protein